MRLDQNIVVVNEFSVKNKKTGRGSRGSTPHLYVLRYVAREDATESDGFVTFEPGKYLDYMVRAEAVEKIDKEFERIRRKQNKESKKQNKKVLTDTNTKKPRRESAIMDGVAFNENSISLSRDELKEIAENMRIAYEDYKTIFKTIISFSQEYLVENHIVPAGFECNEKGDYKGNVDHVKLRQAIREGLEVFSRDFDDLHYVGAIQVDTKHVHCHLTMCDYGEGKRLTKDGEQKGKLLQSSMMKLRRGIDRSLDETKSVSFMAANADVVKRKLRVRMAKSIYDSVTEFGIPQVLLAALPSDPKLWRAGTNEKGMSVAHGLCRNYIDYVLAREYPDEIKALDQSFQDYVNSKAREKKMSRDDRKALLKKCHDNFYKDCENEIYRALRQIPADKRIQSSDFLTLSMSEELVNSGNNNIQDFVYRLHAYNTRHSAHRKNVRKYDTYIEDYKKLQANKVDLADESKVLLDFFEFEREYNLKMTSKYSQMLFVSEPEDDLIDEYELLDVRARMSENLRLLREDSAVSKYKSVETLSEYAQNRYGLTTPYVKYLLTRPEIYDNFVQQYEESYQNDYAHFVQELNLRSKGIVVDNETGKVTFIRQPAYEFDEIRGLDLHDVRYDFGKQFEFDGEVRIAFMECAEKRIELYDKVCDYLKVSHQEEFIDSLFETDDIERMRDIYEKLKTNQPIVNDTDDMGNMHIEAKSVVPVDEAITRRMFNNMMINISSKYIESDDWKKDLD